MADDINDIIPEPEEKKPKKWDSCLRKDFYRKPQSYPDRIQRVADFIFNNLVEFVMEKLGGSKVSVVLDGIGSKRKVNVSKEEFVMQLICIAMRMSNNDMMLATNYIRYTQNKEPITCPNAKYIRSKYGVLIDEVYVIIAKYIGNIYPFTDKLYRVRKLNDLASKIYTELEDMSPLDDKFNKLLNSYIITTSQLNKELGNIPLSKMLNDETNKRLIEEAADELNLKKVYGTDPVDKKLIPNALKKILKERYKNQIPSNIEIDNEKISVDNLNSDEDNDGNSQTSDG